jgi:hypothetical protein
LSEKFKQMIFEAIWQIDIIESQHFKTIK